MFLWAVDPGRRAAGVRDLTHISDQQLQHKVEEEEEEEELHP
jgi:hypothetical protein